MRTERASVCPLDCPDMCSLSVTVEDDRIVRVRGSRANPHTGGVICGKVAKGYPEFVHGPGRLLYPLRRIGRKGEARFQRISWDQALDAIHERFTAVMAAQPSVASRILFGNSLICASFYSDPTSCLRLVAQVLFAELAFQVALLAQYNPEVQHRHHRDQKNE